MSAIDVAVAAGASTEKLVAACVAAMRFAFSGTTDWVVQEAIEAASAWADGCGGRATREEIRHWLRACGHRDIAREAAYWLLSAVDDALAGLPAMAATHLGDCVECAAIAAGGHGPVEAILADALLLRDTIPCPPSAECLEAMGEEAA